MVVRSTLLQEVWGRFSFTYLWVEFLYDQTVRLYLRDEHIMSFTKVQQGGSLEILIFSIVLHPLIHKIKDNCKLLPVFGILMMGLS